MLKREEPRIRIVVNRAQFKEAIADIEAHEYVSWDLETSGLNPRDPGSYITSIGVSTDRYDWAFPMNHIRSPLYLKFNRQKRMMKKIIKVLLTKKTIAQNGQFDHDWIRTLYETPVYIYFDTMLAHYNVNENVRHGLKEITVSLGWDEGYDITLDEKKGLTGSLKKHCTYLGKDTYFTLKLFYYLRKKLKADKGTWGIFNNITMPISRLYCDAKHYGVYLDQEKLKDAKVYWRKQAEESRAKLDKLYPSDNKWKNKKTKQWEYGVNWNSPTQLAEILFDKEGLDPLDLTAKGARSTSESVLLRLAAKSKIPKLVLDYREAMKNLSTFIEAWEREQVDCRIRPNFKVHGTVTGRPSCAEPNLQQVPRNPAIRSIITAPPGWVMLDVDYSQAELRIAAHASRDKELLIAYQTGVDVHSLTVESIFGIPKKKQTKEERKKGKAVNFGFIYGMWWKKFSQYARDNYGVVMEDKESERIRKRFFQKYSGLPDWHKSQKAFAASEGYVRSILGRLRRLPDALREDTGSYNAKKEEALRQAINSPIQSFASDLTLMSAIQIREEFDPSYLRIVGSVHDSILMECREDKVNDVAPRILEIMKRPKLLDKMDIHLSVPLEGELEIGPWASGEEYDVEKGWKKS